MKLQLKKGALELYENRIAVQFVYEWHDTTGQWYRSNENELGEFASLV